MRAELLDAVQWAGVESVGTMGLSLQSDSYMLDWCAEEGVGDAGKCSGGVVLAIAK